MEAADEPGILHLATQLFNYGYRYHVDAADEPGTILYTWPHYGYHVEAADEPGIIHLATQLLNYGNPVEATDEPGIPTPSFRLHIMSICPSSVSDPYSFYIHPDPVPDPTVLCTWETSNNFVLQLLICSQKIWWVRKNSTVGTVPIILV